MSARNHTARRGVLERVRAWTAALLSLVLLAACGDGGADSAARSTPSPVPSLPASPEPTPTLPRAGGEGSTPAPGVEDALRAHLAGRLGVAPAAVALVSLTPMTWPDGCLGLPAPGRACTQALVPGWLAILRGPDGREYRYRGAGASFAPEP